jgi:pyruvate-formate lyase-activating enzyme
MSTAQTAGTERALAQALSQQYHRYAAARTDVGLAMTEQCPVGCRHCLSSSRTMQVPDMPALETHLAWIEQVSHVDRCTSISITGGEPFLHFQRLLQVVDGCRSHGLRATVFTSGYWATSDEIAAEKLNQLSHAGLTYITVSTDEYHQERVPLANVARVLNAAKGCGISRKVALTYLPRGRGAAQVKRDLLRELGQGTLNGVQIEVGGIVKVGRAHELVFPGRQQGGQSKLVCNALGPVIQLDGTVASCCRAPLPYTSPLIMGDLNAEDFQSIYQRFLSHPVIPFIQTWGLLEMLERLIDEGLATGLESYSDAREEEICELCQAILSEPAHVLFFADQYHVPEVRKRLGILTLILYGDPALLKGRDG